MPAMQKKRIRPGDPVPSIAVIDIGSNSIRLVVFDGHHRVPTPLFNEKVICRLGAEVHSTGRLADDAVEMALTNLVRFTRMAEAMGVMSISLLATAAARDAINGADFLRAVESRCGRAVTLLSGHEEARLSALGVLSSLPEASGVMGDLGGGSLELVALRDGEPGQATTLSLGPLRFAREMKGDRKAVRNTLDATLGSVRWWPSSSDATFYAVGGAWRNLARLYMKQSKHPLRVVQGFTLPRKEAEDLTRLVSRLGEQSLLAITEISRRRVETLPYCALLLNRIIKVFEPSQIVFSAFGLREGFLLDQLDREERDKDPLLFSAAELSRREGGFVDFAPEIDSWLEQLFPDRDSAFARLRRAACFLSNIAWREHPDYRPILALQRILYHPFSGVDHEERAFLAQAVFARYGGNGGNHACRDALDLLGEARAKDAKAIGHAIRLAYTLSPGRPQLLQQTNLSLVGDRLVLVLPTAASIPVGEAVKRRLKLLANTLEASDADIRYAPDRLVRAS